MKNTTINKLRSLFPQLIERRDYLVNAEGDIAAWTAPRQFPQPDAKTLAGASEAVAVPQVTQLWRLRAVASLAGIKAGIDKAIDSLPEPTKTVVFAAWNEGNEIHRNSPTVMALSAALGLTSEQLDDFFRQAESLQV